MTPTNLTNLQTFLLIRVLTNPAYPTHRERERRRVKERERERESNGKEKNETVKEKETAKDK